MSSRRAVIVGAGHAGGTFAALLRRSGFDGGIVLIGTEEHLPYHRPPLSKSFHGEPVKWLYEAEFYAENDITIRPGETVVSIDRAAGKVRLASGTGLGYDVLVLATGVEPRRLPLPGDELEGIHTLRTLADADMLREAVNSGEPLAIVGGGYIGLEVAAAARARGMDVTVIEREDRILSRVASKKLSELLTDHHRDRGTRILTGAGTTGFICDRGRVGGIRLDDGTTVPCSTALIGAGAIPRDGLARQTGLACEGGIVVDDVARTSDPGILAIGDVTSRPVAGRPGRRMRLESIPSAVEQAKQAVAAVMGLPAVGPEVPWFWSDQFDLKIKIAGVVHGDYETVLRGDPQSGSYSLFHHDGGRLVAAETVNAPREFMAAKRVLSSRGFVDPSALANSSIDLRELSLI
jgi:3-phenylpropionate/trans-cinnamate dioxygenase ferredoxin reductase component